MVYQPHLMELRLPVFPLTGVWSPGFLLSSLWRSTSLTPGCHQALLLGYRFISSFWRLVIWRHACRNAFQEREAQWDHKGTLWFCFEESMRLMCWYISQRDDLSGWKTAFNTNIGLCGASLITIGYILFEVGRCEGSANKHNYIKNECIVGLWVYTSRLLHHLFYNSFCRLMLV